MGSTGEKLVMRYYMQKTITFFIIAIISVITFYGCANAKVEENYLRIHIRANSNVEID